MLGTGGWLSLARAAGEGVRRRRLRLCQESPGQNTGTCCSCQLSSGAFFVPKLALCRKNDISSLILKTKTTLETCLVFTAR